MKPLTIIHTECSRGWGGQEIRVFTEMKAMRGRGHRLLLASPKDSQIFQRAQDAGFDVWDFSDARWSYPVSVSRLATFFAKEHADIVNTHSSRDGWIAGVAARIARGTGATPALVRSRHIEVSYPNRFLSGVAYKVLPDAILTTSEQIRLGLLGRLNIPEERVVCVPTGIDLEKFHPGVSGAGVRHELRVEPQTPLIGMVSVLRSWKGHDVFLQSAQRILQKRRDVRFIIAGDGPMRPAVERKIQELGLEDFVFLIGHREDTAEVISALDVLALPSLAHEGIPQIILQTLAVGRPVVGSRVGGIPEIIEDGETGLLVEPGDASALAVELLRLIDNVPMRERLAQNGRSRVLLDFSLDTMCQKVESVYRRVLG